MMADKVKEANKGHINGGFVHEQDKDEKVSKYCVFNLGLLLKCFCGTQSMQINDILPNAIVHKKVTDKTFILGMI